jgi:hypothetical protein
VFEEFPDSSANANGRVALIMISTIRRLIIFFMIQHPFETKSLLLISIKDWDETTYKISPEQTETIRNSFEILWFFQPYEI